MWKVLIKKKNIFFFFLYKHYAKSMGSARAQLLLTCLFLSRDARKPVFGVSDQVQYKPGCTATEDGKRREISAVESRGIVLSM